MADVPGTGNALLALEAAVNAGAPVPPERFLAALELLLRWQAPSGQATRLRLEVVGGDRRHAWSQMARARGWGWTGSRGDKPEGDATASGVLGLAVCKGALQGHASLTPALRAQTDDAIYDGLAWLQEHFSVRRNPDPRGAAPSGLEAQSRCLWLLRLVQVGEHLRLRQVGRCDWYREGAEALLEEQQDDGAWKKPVLRPIDPLLLLLRAGPVPSTVVLTPPQEGGE